MKKVLVVTMLLFFAGLSAQEIQWRTIQEAEKEMKDSDKPLFIDFYTDWCSWCRVMDRKTFTEPEVIDYINNNYIAVKFDAESKEKVSFRGKDYRYVKPQGGGFRGVNSFAYFSLRGQLSYPSYAVIFKDGKLDRILKGYMDKGRLLEGLTAEK